MMTGQKAYDSAVPVDQKVLTLVDEIRAAAETDVPMDDLKARAAAMTEVERLQLWARATKEGLSVSAFRRVHATLAAAIMDVFSMPMGEAGIGVRPKVSAEVADFYQKVDPSWERHKDQFDPKDG